MMLQTMKITNVADANKYLSREYRSGWDPIHYNWEHYELNKK